jgi:hypothetical protein
MAFVPSVNLLERAPRWYDALEDLLIAHQASGECELVVDDEVLSLSLYSPYERFAAYIRIISLLSRKSPSEQREVMDQITDALSSCEGETDSHAALDAQQLRRLGEAGCVCIGGATHHHVDPDTLAPHEQLLEIGKNKEILEEILGKRIERFSCPFWAVHGSSLASADVLWELGFTLGFSNNRGSTTIYTKSDQFTLPRVSACDKSPLGLHQGLVAAGWPAMRSGAWNEDKTAYRR